MFRYWSKWIGLIFLIVILFYWKIVFTKQFSTALQWETANTAYAWTQFAASSLQSGFSPLWNPFTFSGHSFLGEMQTGLFDPLKILYYLTSPDYSGMISERTYNHAWVLAHFLAASFMFILAIHLGLEGFPAVVAALTFALSGFMGNVVWPNMLNAAAWLPLIVLLLLKALQTDRWPRKCAHACGAGLCLGMTVLAGSVHVAIMDVLVVVSLVVYLVIAGLDGLRFNRKAFLWCGSIIAIVGAVSFLFGAVQLVPSIEYSQFAIRWVGGTAPLQATEKIPYSDLAEIHRFFPRSIVGLFFRWVPMDGAEFSPYLGVLPILLAIFGVRCYWKNPIVRYLTLLAVFSFLYCWGSYFFLHGLMYLMTPLLWMAREADRFIYLTHFALALLAGFGVQALFHIEQSRDIFKRFLKGLGFVVMGLAVTLGIPALYGSPVVSEHHYFGLVFFIASYALLSFLQRSGGTLRKMPVAQFLVIVILLSDFDVFAWVIRGKDENRWGKDYLKELIDARPLAEFFKSQPGQFRVDIRGENPPNIGDAYGVQTTWGSNVSAIREYAELREKVPRANDLLNVRYLMQDTERPGEAEVFHAGKWKVYENRTGLPRAWVIHTVERAEDRQKLLAGLSNPEFDPLKTAWVDGSEIRTDAASGQPEEVMVSAYQNDRIDLRAKSQTSGLLVLSELDYPGWKATINGKDAPIHKVNGIFRAVNLPPGESSVVFRYRPRSVLIGLAASIMALLASVGLYAVSYRRSENSQRSSKASIHEQAS